MQLTVLEKDFDAYIFVVALAKGGLAGPLIEESAKQLHNFLEASVDLMKILARACGHARLRDFNIDDLTTWKREMADLAGVHYGGVADLNGKTK